MCDHEQSVSCQIDPTVPLVCGEMTTRTFIFTVREQISPLGRLRIYFTQSPYYRKPPIYGMSAKGFIFYHRVHFQTHDPQGIGYLTASTASGSAVKIELAPGQCYFTLVFGQGLSEGDRLTVVIGDRSAGGPGIEVAHHPTYGEWQLLCEVDRQGDGRFVRQQDLPKLRVVSSPPSKLLVHIPSQAQLHDASDLQITVVDQYGNHVENYAGRFQVTVEGEGQGTTDFALAAEDAGSRRFSGGVVFTRPGNHRVRVESVDHPEKTLPGLSNPTVCQEEPDGYKLLWADLHGHTWCTDGTHSPGFYYTYGRTVGFLDVCALTDHDTFNHDVWQEMVSTAEHHNEPHRFTTFLGYEWTGDLSQSLNVLFKSGAGNYYPASAMTSQHYADFVMQLAQDGDALISRHDLPGLGSQWPVVDPSGQLERLVQIYSFMLSSEAPDLPYTRGVIDAGNSVQAALSDDFRFGFLGSSDTHASMPGRRHSLTKGTSGYGSRPYGLTGIYARENTRSAVFDALYERRCYAATDRILLDFRINGHWMGEEISLAGPRYIEARVVGTAPIDYIAVIKNNQILHSAGVGETEASFTITDDADLVSSDFYYLRVVQTNGDLAWSSPIWVDIL